MTLSRTYRAIARETHRVIARADRATDNDAAARVAAREAHEAAGRARFLAAPAAGLDPAAIQTMKAFADLPAGYPVLRAIEKALGAAPIAMGGGGAAAQWTKESLRAAQADPRADMNSSKYDAKFAAEIDRGYQQLYGRSNG
jgi:hypothetical protein